MLRDNSGRPINAGLDGWHEWSFGLGRLWLEVVYNPWRRVFDLHGAGWSFTLDLGPIGFRGGIERSC